MRNASLTHALLCAAAVSVLAGCATPRYRDVARHEAPAGAAAQTCVAGCEAALRDCGHRCAERHQACVQRVEPQVEEQYRQALDRYASELADYRFDLLSMEFQFWSGWGRPSFWNAPWRYDPWPAPYYRPAPPPGPPTRDAVRARFLERQCGADCGCQAPYDACYVGCGGRIVQERRCVENCPEAGD